MKTSITVDLKPFLVPNFAVEEVTISDRSAGIADGRSWPLAAIDADTLDRMCSEFYMAVFKKAGKTPPPRAS